MSLPLGEVVEWFMALVLKTSVSARAPSVRIRPSPFNKHLKPSHSLGFLLSCSSPTADWEGLGAEIFMKVRQATGKNLATIR